MTPAQVAALLVGASVNDGTGALATVTLTRPLFKLPGDEDGLIELKWTSGPHTNRISVFNYDDPCFQKFSPGVVLGSLALSQFSLVVTALPDRIRVTVIPPSLQNTDPVGTYSCDTSIAGVAQPTATIPIDAFAFPDLTLNHLWGVLSVAPYNYGYVNDRPNNLTDFWPTVAQNTQFTKFVLRNYVPS